MEPPVIGPIAGAFEWLGKIWSKHKVAFIHVVLPAKKSIQKEA